MTEYIYLLHPFEFINNDIYKIGKTKQENLKRFGNYPKGSVLLYQTICINCDITEKEILKLFKNKYKLVKGYEYFKGDYNEMINDIYQFTNNDINNKMNTQMNNNPQITKANSNHRIITIKITNNNNKEGYLLTSDGLWYKFSNNYKDKQLLLWFKNRYNKNYDEFINNLFDK